MFLRIYYPSDEKREVGIIGIHVVIFPSCHFHAIMDFKGIKRNRVG